MLVPGIIFALCSYLIVTITAFSRYDTPLFCRKYFYVSLGRYSKSRLKLRNSCSFLYFTYDFLFWRPVYYVSACKMTVENYLVPPCYKFFALYSGQSWIFCFCVRSYLYYPIVVLKQLLT